MQLKKAPFHPHESLGRHIVLLLVFLIFLIPISRIFGPGFRVSAEWAYFLFLFGVIVPIGIINRIPFASFGIKTPYWGRDLCIGTMLGLALLCTLPLIDLIISHSKMAASELFVGADRRIIIDPPPPLTYDFLFLKLLVAPLALQVFWTGFILHSRVNRLPTGGFIFLGGLIFSISQLNFGLGVFLLGMISAGLFRLTGAVFSGFVFNVAAAGTAILCLYSYPKTITFLTVFF